MEANTLIARIEQAWRQSDRLFDLVAPAALKARPISLRHPFLFYIGHLPAFAWNQLGRGVLREPPLDRHFDPLFARGIDPAAAPSEVLRLPEPERVFAYRDRARQALREAMRRLDRADPRDPLVAGHSVLYVILEHEWMHHETLLYMVQALPHSEKRPPDRAAPVLSETPWTPLPEVPVQIPAGMAILGARGASFAWDNELPPCRRQVEAFAMNRLPVTIGDFLSFVRAGSYSRPELWLPQDRAWIESNAIRMPLTWRAEGDELFVRTLFGDVPIEKVLDWPASVTHAEAAAFARAHNAELPSEAEYVRAAFAEPTGPQQSAPWGDEPLTTRHANLGLTAFSPTPVGSKPLSRSALGVDELYGDGWEWTRTPFGPFPGFRPYLRTYPQYSEDFFDNQHYVMLGGSFATAPGLLRPSFRNWFRSHYPYVFSKFRRVYRGAAFDS